jgi:hypothetical protein
MVGGTIEHSQSRISEIGLNTKTIFIMLVRVVMVVTYTCLFLGL